MAYEEECRTMEIDIEDFTRQAESNEEVYARKTKSLQEEVDRLKVKVEGLENEVNTLPGIISEMRNKLPHMRDDTPSLKAREGQVQNDYVTFSQSFLSATKKYPDDAIKEITDLRNKLDTETQNVTKKQDEYQNLLDNEFAAALASRETLNESFKNRSVYPKIEGNVLKGTHDDDIYQLGVLNASFDALYKTIPTLKEQIDNSREHLKATGNEVTILRAEHMAPDESHILVLKNNLKGKQQDNQYLRKTLASLEQRYKDAQRDKANHIAKTAILERREKELNKKDDAVQALMEVNEQLKADVEAMKKQKTQSARRLMSKFRKD